MDKKISAYLQWKGTYAPRAAVNYERWLKQFVSLCGSKKLKDYGVPDIVKYKNWLADKLYAPATVQLATVALHNFFKFSKMNGEKCMSPEFIRVQRMKARSHRPATEDEVKRIIEAIPEFTFIGLRDRLIMSLFWDTGMRVSELCSIDMDQVSRGSRKATIVNRKNANSRIIMWSEATHALLCAYLPLRAIVSPQRALFIGVAPKGVTRLTLRSIERSMGLYVKKAGIEGKVTPHSLRHGWANYRRDRFNAPLPFLQKALGHINPISTFVYQQYSDKDFESQAEKYLEQAYPKIETTVWKMPWVFHAIVRRSKNKTNIVVPHY